MKILIVENEQKQREVLLRLISFTKYDTSEVKAVEGVESALQILNTYSPDVVLLDIELNDGSGFDLLKHYPKHLNVIVITGREEYALQAIKNRAIDYLLKPIDPLELETALDKFFTGKSNFVRNPSNPFITLNTLNNIYKINFSDIIYCESEGNYTTINTVDDKQIVVTKPLKEIESLLPNPDFLRVHRSFIVNRCFIYIYNKLNNKIELKTGNYIPVSKSKKQQLLQEFV